ncbi:MAG TPA: nuclease-related domain-containing protein [Solirubrobacteraceae bacterium]
MDSRSRSAGRSADVFFRQARDRWRRRVVRRVEPFLLVPVIALCLAHVVWPVDLLSWSLGLAAGGLVGIWVWLRDSPAPHIENWRTGRDAERRTARALAGLARDGWAIAHDVASARGNVDHVLVGPAGVFLVDTKQLGGVTTIRGDLVRVEPPDNPRATYEPPNLSRSVRRAAAALSRELERLANERVWVQPVVVFWNDFPAGAVDAERVVFLAGDRAASWLEQQPRRLTPASLEALKRAVAALPPAC